MKTNLFRILCLGLLTAGLCLTPAAAAAQNGTPAPDPKIIVIVSLQQDTLRINDQVQGVLEISNQSDTATDDATFQAVLPDFLEMHTGSCKIPPQSILGSLILGPLPAHSIKSQPVCITLDTSKARTGSFNVLFVVTYTWGQKTDLVTAEKTVQVDLIGNQTILGLPLAFAGFILPGLMLLIALRWFNAPWAVNLSGEDRLIYSVLISLLLLGPFAVLGSLIGASAPGWVQFLNISQEVTIERLGAYVLIGLAFGAGIGGTYRKIKSDRARKLAALQISPDDDYKAILWKALQLNSDYHGGKYSFQPRDEKENSYTGAFYAYKDNKLYIFPAFRLDGEQLDEQTRGQIKLKVESAPDIGKRRDLLLEVLGTIQKPPKDLIKVADAVFKIPPDGSTSISMGDNRGFVELDAADFRAPVPTEGDEDYVLLDIQI